MLAVNANIGDEDDFADILGEDLGNMFDAGAMVNFDVGPGSLTGTDDLSVPSGPAHSFGPGACQVAAAQYNSDYSVVNQSVASSDQRSVTINQGLSLQEADALTQYQVGHAQAAADATLNNLRAEATSVLTASAHETRAAQQRADSNARRAEEKAKRAADRGRRANEGGTQANRKSELGGRRGAGGNKKDQG